MSEAVTLGFGAGSNACVLRSDAGALICRAGETSQLRGPRVRKLDGTAGWEATAEEGLDVVLEPLGEPARFTDGTREWLCRARGAAGGEPVDCLGHAVLESTPPASWKRAGLSRDVAAWLREDLAVTLRARRPGRAKNHEDEELEGFLLRGSLPEPHPIDDPRLSTTYTGDGRQRRAGLELWETEESDFPLRLAGEAIGEGELELKDGMRLCCAFFVWRHAGRVGAGRYDIVLTGAETAQLGGRGFFHARAR